MQKTYLVWLMLMLPCYYFCKLVKEHNKVALTGECADEIFGGYPWFYREDLMNSDTFPWSIDTQPRLELLDDDFIDNLNINEYIKARYKDSLSEMPEIDYKDETERRRYEITFKFKMVYRQLY